MLYCVNYASNNMQGLAEQSMDNRTIYANYICLRSNCEGNNLWLFAEGISS